MKVYLIILSIFLISLSSCSALKEAEKEIERQKIIIEELEKQKEYEPKRQAANSKRDEVKHIVFFKLVKGSDKNSLDKFSYLLRELENIEYISSIELCHSLEKKYTKHVRSDYDIILYMTFPTEMHLAKYQQQETHIKIQEATKGFISDVWSYDFKTVEK